MREVYVLSVYLHIVLACFWIGGMLFLSFVLLPVIKKPEYARFYNRLVEETGVNFSRIGWVVLFLFFLTGVFQLHIRGVSLPDILSGRAMEGFTGRVATLKLLLYALLLLLQALHDFWLGPKATSLGISSANSREYLRYKGFARVVGISVFFISLLMALLGVVIVRGGFL